MRFLIIFDESGSLFVLEIAYNDSLQQYLTSTRCKTQKKTFLGPNLGQASQNRARK